MLVLTRKVNESIQINGEITVTVVRVGPAAVRIGVEAPPHMTVLRGELADGQPDVDRHESRAKLPACK